MARYFLELSYNGSAYSGFQVQQNANTIQAEVEKALGLYYRETFSLTGSSRTDAGVHALQNFFHFDTTDQPGSAGYLSPECNTPGRYCDQKHSTCKRRGALPL